MTKKHHHFLTSLLWDQSVVCILPSKKSHVQDIPAMQQQHPTPSQKELVYTDANVTVVYI